MSFIQNIKEQIETARVLLVGAGGIGCEVLKNLTLTGFKNIDAIDLDTIDVSNLNRQFLFNRTHVGKSKAEVAVDTVKKNYSTTNSPKEYNLNSMHKSVMLSEFDKEFFKSYTIVINALDNRAARTHVNRMCIAADVPLLESGTEGYLGQTNFIKKSLTACYECEGLQKEGKTYATCTIRNTPSEPIHCIVWAKHLFHQLFGESDPDTDVSPQMEEEAQTSHNNHVENDDKNNVSSSTEAKLQQAFNSEKNGHENKTNGNFESKGDKEKPKIVTTREWAIKNDYDSNLLLEKLFRNDIEYLLRMDNLWKERKKPELLDIKKILNEPNESGKLDCSDACQSDQSLWSLRKCVDKFIDTTKKLKQRMDSEGDLIWDKDDAIAMEFVVAASNLRCENFHVSRKSPFETKSLAGNIVPAISSTNSIIAGLLVLQALRLLQKMVSPAKYQLMKEEDKNELLNGVGRLAYLKKNALVNTNLISSYESFPPQPNCLACSRDTIPEFKLNLSLDETTLGDLVDKIVIKEFHFVCPDICISDGLDSGTIIWSEDEMDQSSAVKKRKLSEIPKMNKEKTRLTVYDLIQDKTITILLIND